MGLIIFIYKLVVGTILSVVILGKISEALDYKKQGTRNTFAAILVVTVIFKPFLNLPSVSAILTSYGNLFHNEGADLEKARSAYPFVLLFSGMSSINLLVILRFITGILFIKQIGYIRRGLLVQCFSNYLNQSYQ